MGAAAGLKPWLQWCSMQCNLWALQGLVQLQQSVAAVADAFQRQVASDRQESLRELLDEKYPGSSGLLHKICHWRSAWAPPTGSISKKVLPAAPQDAVEEDMRQWSSIWGAEEQTAVEAPWRGHIGKWSRPSVDAVRDLCRRYKKRTGLGRDCWHPRHWSWLPDERLQELLDVMDLCAACGRWPTHAWLLVVFLVPKPEGGSRPLVLFPT